MNQGLAAKSIGELAPLLSDKQISPIELTEAVLQNVDMYNEQINAYISVEKEIAIKAATLQSKKYLMEITKVHYMVFHWL
jgi:aspartyl-tRNA(Asn)/glutamyl-tRNA(Gln) amidotransferase subunit A